MDAVESVELRTDRLVVEPLTVEHAGEMISVLGDPDLYGFTGGSPPKRAELVDRYEHQVRGSGRPDERWFNWIVRRSDIGIAVGYVQATVVAGTADVAWVIGSAHQRQGFARESANVVVRWLAEQGVTRVTAHIAADHVRSARVAISLALERTGAIDDDGEEVWARDVPLPANRQPT